MSKDIENRTAQKEAAETVKKSVKRNHGFLTGKDVVKLTEAFGVQLPQGVKIELDGKEHILLITKPEKFRKAKRKDVKKLARDLGKTLAQE